MGRLRRLLPAAVVVGLAVALFAAAVVHHVAEIKHLGQTSGPLSAFATDTILTVALAAAGYWLHTTDLRTAHRWDVALWSAFGAAAFAVATLLTVAIREFEGRQVAEPAFPVLVSAAVGALAGFVAGTFYVRAHRDAERAAEATRAFSFVNDVLRHDVRNSLGVVRGKTDLVAATTDDEAVAEHAETVQEHVDEALERIDDANVIANTLTDDAPVEAVDVVPIVAAAAERVDDAYEATVTTDLPESALVRANDAVKSVVSNLVENAAEHNDADDPRVDVAVDVRADAVRLDVRDNGPGVTADVLEAANGGLDLVQTLVDHYDGDLRVEANEPRGTVFSVVLPRADAD